MYSIDSATTNLITRFMHDLQDWFEKWFNGTADKESLQEYEKRMHPNWRLVNKETPKVINDKETFLRVWPSFYGRFKDKPIKQKCDIQSIEELSQEFYLVIHYEITETQSEIKKRPITTILIKDIETQDLQIYLVHE